MLKSLKEFLTAAHAPAADALTADRQVLRACAELLVEISRADAAIDTSELQSVREVFRSRFGLSEGEAGQELALALGASERSTSLHSVLQVINDNLHAKEKERLIEELWTVAFADQRLDRYEEHQIRRIAELIHVPHHAFIRAKLKVQALSSPIG